MLDITQWKLLWETIAECIKRDSQYTNIDTIVLIINPVKIVFRVGDVVHYS